jgi:hypothetical protein
MVDVGQIEYFWHLLEDDLRKSFLNDDSCYTTDDVKDSCLNELCQLWLATENDEYRGFTVTEIRQTPQKRLGHFCWGGGHEMRKWFGNGVMIISEWMKSQGCDGFYVTGRKGWVKMIDFDYEEGYYYKKL